MTRARAALIALALSGAALALTPVRAQEAAPPPAETVQGERVSVQAQTDGGYARMVFTWPSPVTVQPSIADNVLVLRFARPFRTNLAALERGLRGYVNAVRQDEDLRTLRLGLARQVRLHSSMDGRLVAFDLVPPEMKADPPKIADASKAPPPPTGPAAVRLRVGETQLETRIVFEWPDPVAYEAKVEEGRITLNFARASTLNVGRLSERPPAFVRGAKAELGDKTTQVVIDTDPSSAIVHAKLDKRVVVTVKAPGGEDSAVAEAPKTETPKPDTPNPKEQAEAPIAPESEPSEAPADKPADKPKDAPAETAEAKPSGPPQLTVLRGEETLRITLPHAASAGFALFAMDGAIHALMDGAPVIDVEAILKGNRDRLNDATVSTAQGVTTLTLRPKTALVASAESEGGAWRIHLGPDTGAPARPIAFVRDTAAQDLPRLRATLAQGTRLVTVTEASSGMSLMAVLARGAPQSAATARAYVEFDVLPSAQGLVLRPRIDELSVTLGRDDVLIGAPGGLTLSAGSVADYAPDRLAVGDTSRPAFMPFDLWKGAGLFREERVKRLAAIDPEGRGLITGRLDLARFYLGHELGAEAYGALKLALSADPGLASDPAFRALRGVSLILLGRPEQAVDDLSGPALADDPNAALFLGMALVKTGAYGTARDAIQRGEVAMAAYPAAWAARFRLAGAEAALKTNALTIAARFLAALPESGAPAEDLPQPLRIEADLRRAELAERQQRMDEALVFYQRVAQSGYRPLAVQGQLGAITVQQATGALTADMAVEALDRLRWQWRGDRFELTLLRRLGQMMVADGRYRDGLQVMRAAMLGFPKDDLAREIGVEMGQIFEQLFLEGKADAMPPVQALGLYFEFKELTPIGARGDEMVRRLADRLIAVDLLAQAAELLQHQVDNRLEGVAKAQIAARLAAVYLMDRKPERALAALRSSTQTRLPDDLALRRRLLTARAQSDLKQADAALETIDSDETPEAARLRADILWAAVRWPEAATALEVLLTEASTRETALSAPERTDVLRAAIAYTMAEDAAGLSSLRGRFLSRMGSGREASAFDLVTRAVDPSGLAFRDLARAIAGIDTLETFLKDLGLGRPDAPPPPA